jgi:hypothetical protein
MSIVTHSFGLAVPRASSRRLAWVALSRDLGHLTRHMVTIDNLLAVDIVLADGRFVTASVGTT